MVYEWPLRDHIHHNIGIHTPLDLLEVVMDLEVPDPKPKKWVKQNFDKIQFILNGKGRAYRMDGLKLEFRLPDPSLHGGVADHSSGRTLRNLTFNFFSISTSTFWWSGSFEYMC